LSPNSPPPSKPKNILSPTNRLSILGLPLDPLSRSEVLERSSSFLSQSPCRQIVTLNALMVLEAETNEELRLAGEKAALVTADSSGIAWAAFKISGKHLERYPGIDLAFDLCRVCSEQGFGVYLLGGAPNVAATAARRLQDSFPKLKIAGTRDGFFKSEQEKEVLSEMSASGAHLFLIGLGMPKQELWIHRNLNKFSHGVAVGVGGTLDVWAGKVKRAPNFYRRFGIEWLYRLWQEPYRWMRIAQLPKFALKVALERRSSPSKKPLA
jgi:N-acetylglucosaminyldiphosphoundecaprenol N-acetyl-beta-D-mannosaminyltransferase